MKQILLLTLCIVTINYTHIAAQNVGIGTKAPDESALLDLSSDDKGLLVPRLTTIQKAAITKPAEGLLIYQTDGESGFYFFKGDMWKPLSANEAKSVAGVDGDWTTTGNAGMTTSNFIGTTDYQTLSFRTNNTERALIDASGKFITNNSAQINGHDIGTGGIYYNVANLRLGKNALNIATGIENIAIGSNTLLKNTTGFRNTAVGYQAMYFNTTGSYNVALGYQALVYNQTGSHNFGLGQYALGSNTTGYSNVAVGTHAVRNNTTGIGNTAIGTNSLYSGFNINNNTAIGYNAGFSATGSNNVFIGNYAGSSETGSHKLYISNSATINPLIRGEFDNKLIRINVGPSNTNTQGYFAIGNFDASTPMSIAPGYRLVVQDGIITEKLKIALKTSSFWADYVFEPEYALMPLSEVDSYIKREKHLPNVPSAADVENDGIDIARMNAKLLEKIEELTLYIIEQQKQIEQQNSRIELLEKSHYNKK